MKKTINLLVILSLMLLFPSSALATTSFSFTSPNKRIMVNVDNKEGKILLSVAYARNKSYQSIVEDIPIGITTSKRNLTDNLTLSSKGKSQESKVNYTMITGKRSKCSNKANATILTFKNDKGEELALELRAYNDGVTFRYLVPKVLTDENLLDEATSYRITEGTNRWLQIYHSDSYEDF
mgnify:FL=1